MTTTNFIPFDQRTPTLTGGDPLTPGFVESTTTLIITPHAGVPASSVAEQLEALFASEKFGIRSFAATAQLDGAVEITVSAPDAAPVFGHLLEARELVTSVNGLPVRHGRKPAVVVAAATPA